MNRKTILTVILFLIPSFALLSLEKDGEEQMVLDELIASTERQLYVQKELKALVEQFQAQQDLFLKGQQTKELATKMVQTANRILKLADENHYMHLFSDSFKEGLKICAGITKKKLPHRPVAPDKTEDEALKTPSKLEKHGHLPSPEGSQ